ncbi:MAG TPA: hypothetical protein VGW98_06605 [Solirubrobacteraceae bacterium]|jgi:hypothetical protein|nr:hypothetical protein [Solirubrobacteraceae bacterium]
MSARRLCPSILVATIAGSILTASVPPLSAAGSSARGPSVQSMIVGRGGSILSRARNVTASATTVRAGRATCAVAAGTPLAVLAAVRHSGGPVFALRDYGRCGSSPQNSGQLFVYSLGGESNRGQSGWEYKVDHVSGSTGAGDPTGPKGDGRRLRQGADVLWFWCNAFAGGCQRTLDIAASATTVSRRALLNVTVNGYDNEGRGSPIAGAIVTLGSDFASTGTGGNAALIAPGIPGRYSLSASRPGLVTSFPETIVVR